MKGKPIEEISNPKDSIIKVAAKSVLISRIPGSGNDEFKTATIKVFDVYNPHKSDVFPTKEYKFTNVEKVRFKGLNNSYYLEGSDIVINDLKELTIFHEGIKLELSGTQVPGSKN